MNDLISVILPCYKAEKYIANIIGDMQAQTYDNFELIIVSNGPDQGEQLQVAQSFAQRDRRIKILTTQTGGVSNARNLGMERASGDWLAFVDADDRLIPSHLQLMADAADGYDIVIGGFYMVADGKESPRRASAFEGKPSFLGNEPLIVGSPCNKLYRKHFVGKQRFCEKYSMMEDYLFNLYLYLQTDSITIIPMTGYKYIWHEGDNAKAQYHASREEVQKEIDSLLFKIQRKCGVCEMDAKTFILKSKYINTYCCVINYFKKGCTLTLRQKRNCIANLIFYDEDLSAAYQYAPWSHQHPYVKVLSLGYKLHSPWFITLTFAFMFWIRSMLSKE